MTNTFYRGRHRAPTALKTSLLGTLTAAALTVAVPGIASADTLDAIAQCESGGRTNATNGSHFGLFQFDMPTWKSVGGKGNPMHASAEEQRARAERLLAERGTQPWTASKHCWSSKTRQLAKKLIQPKRDNAAPLKAASEKVVRKIPPISYVIQAGDTLGDVAKKKGTSVGALMRLNPQLGSPHRIIAGQKLRV